MTRRGACDGTREMLPRQPGVVDEVVIMGERRQGQESAADDRGGLLDRETERFVGVLEVALLVEVLVVFAIMR